MKKKNKYYRLDEKLVELKLAPDRESALPLIMSGSVLVNGQTEYKASAKVEESWTVFLKERMPFVSRGALKIKNAFKEFQIGISGIKVLDIGISTGGFTDYVLQNGASEVIGIDVNTDQVDYNLRKNNKLTLLKKNAREIKKKDVFFNPDLIVMDLSFISITKVMPALRVFRNVKILSLVKPQFEAPRGMVKKGGIVDSVEDRIEIVLSVKEKLEEQGYGIVNFTKAGVKGQKGNQEYFFLIEYGKKSINDDRIRVGIENV